MNKFILEHVAFQRSVLSIDGICNIVSLSKKLFFINDETGQRIDLYIESWEGERFSANAMMFGCNSGQPITNGQWYIGIEDEAGNVVRASVSDELYDYIYLYKETEVNMDFMVDKSAKNYFHAFSRLDEETFNFYLEVQYHIPKKNKHILVMWKNNVKRRHKARLRLIRNRVFCFLFKLINSNYHKKGNRILFTSDSRAEIGGNEKFVYDRMVELGIDKQYDIHFMFKASVKKYRSLKNKFLFVYYLATSDYIFMDDYQPEIYKVQYDPDVKIIQLWHACGAFKTVGFERIKAKGGPAFNTSVHKCYTHVPVSSELVVNHYSEAFALDRSKFYPVGVPRTDIFFDENYKKETMEKMYEEFPLAKKAERVILYAPTFRGAGAKSAYFPTHMLNYRKIGEYLKKSNSVMIIKMHPFVSNAVKIPEDFEDVFIDASEYREVNDILFITDVLITDYSSVIYEMGLLNKPMLFYAFDLKSYVADRGFYEPYESMVPGKIVKNIQELLTALEQNDFEQEKLSEFVERNFTYRDGKSTDRVLQLVFGEKILGENGGINEVH